MPITYQELRRCAALAREADRLREQIIRMRAKLEGVSPSPMGTPRGGGVKDVIGRAIAVLDATERKWLRVIEEYTAMMLRVEAAIAGVDNPDHRTVLRMRYLDGERWGEIARQMGYTRDGLMSINQRWIKKCTHKHT